MGKEGYEKDWCYICKLFTKEWQQAGYAPGEEWTIGTLFAQFQSNKATGVKCTAMSGVKTTQFFDEISVRRVLFSVLHAMMGLTMMT